MQRLGGAWGERMKVIQGWIKCAKEIHMGISLLLKAQAYIRYLHTLLFIHPRTHAVHLARGKEAGREVRYLR